jgi:predicted anti-sigma-YlaC factor YlaD
MYVAYKNGQVDSETKLWMEQHKKECTYCREWCLSVDENREDKTDDKTESKNIEKNNHNEIRKIFEKLKITLVIGLSFVLFAGLYISGLLKS